jgi:SAM-dependent methyltransferase
VLPAVIAAAIGRFAGRLRPGARVLEIGSGSGRDALALEESGLSVRRTDITPAFVTLLREAGHRADQVDPLRDDLADPDAPEAAYDGVWANASLLHVDRDDLPTVLARLAGVTRPGGALFVSVKEGDGEDWSVHGNVTAPRFFTFWRDGPLRSVVEAAGWTVLEVVRVRGRDSERWLEVTASRA